MLLLLLFIIIPEIDADPASFLGGRGGVSQRTRIQQQPGCKCFFLQCSPVHLLAAGVEPVWKLLMQLALVTRVLIAKCLPMIQ